MALAIKMPGMGTGDDPTLHPFFSAAKNVDASVVVNPPLKERKRKPRLDRKDAESKELAIAKPRGRPKKKQQLSLSSQKCGEPLSKTESGVRTVVQKDGSPGRTDETLDLHKTHANFVIDLNTNPSKRRRTSSSTHATTDKLDSEEAASIGEVSSVVPASGPENTLEMQGFLPKKNEGVTDEKRVLKLWADGKLGSPKSRTSIYKSRKKEKERIIILKYGSDETSRQVLGRRISDILEGATNTTLSFVNSKQKTPIETGSSKATHPFFLGKTRQPAEKPVVSQDAHIPNANLSGSSTIGDGGHILPQASVSTSKKGAETWVGFGRLGSLSGISGNMRPHKYPGAMEPDWPSKGLVHIRGSSSITLSTSPINRMPSQRRKLKGNEVQIPKDQSVLRPYDELTHVYQSNLDLGDKTHERSSHLRKPRRRIMTGPELQDAIRQKVESVLPLTSRVNRFINSNHLETKTPSNIQATGEEQIHGALLNIFESMASSQSAFDRFECETQEWIHKYSPKCATTVLQKGREAVLLRDWLKSLTVKSTNSGIRDVASTREPIIVPKQYSSKAKRKRKRANKLPGFILSSDEEADEMEELTETEDSVFSQEDEIGIKKSVIRIGDVPRTSGSAAISVKNANAAVISGPHGCGKTAAVYAVAQELGFEVFEINSGTRRSGKDLLDKVGEMTKNHLVHQGSEQEMSEKQKSEPDVSTEQELSNGRQSMMSDFLKPKAKSKSTTKSRNSQNTSELPNPSKKTKTQKQSLILLEEVDVLFEEDKQFWSTVINLLFQSKRPIIMTCNDEAQLPLDELKLHAIFRFSPPPESVATDYLLLLAGNEGHLLSRAAISTLYKAKHFDLRASIAELNFWCQMAIGDVKGGLDWLPIQSPSTKYHNENGEKQRVISEDSYVLGMGLLETNYPGVASMTSTSDDTNLLATALNEFNIDVEDWYELISISALTYATSNTLPHESLHALERAEQYFDGISSSDVLPYTRIRSEHKTTIETTLPALSETIFRDYTEAFQLLQADPVQDPGETSTMIALSLKACSRKVMFDKQLEQCVIPLDDTAINKPLLLQKSRTPHSHLPMASLNIASAFGPLMDSPTTPTMHAKGSQISIFDGPTSAIVQDVAPYVRSIVSYDLQLEEQRLRLSNLLSQGGRHGKRQRTTRASRAALEGGSKAYTRRERWFPKNLDFSLVLQSGGKEWQKAVGQEQTSLTNLSGSDLGRSRRSSADTCV